MAKLRITQIKSRVGASKIQKQNLDALGLHRINKSVEHEDSAIIKGMISKVSHLVKVETL